VRKNGGICKGVRSRKKRRRKGRELRDEMGRANCERRERGRRRD